VSTLTRILRFVPPERPVESGRVVDNPIKSIRRAINLDEKMRGIGLGERAIARELGVAPGTLIAATRARKERRMPKGCPVCRHPRRDEIALALLKQGPKAVAKQFGLKLN